MSWPVATYSGTAMGGIPSTARTALHALCQGINERQAAINITKTQFYKADGTEAADLATGDLENLRAAGPSSPARANLERVRLAIVSMLTAGYFMNASGGGATALTVGAVETAIGSSISDEPERINEARYWQALQDALDLMIYARRIVAPTATGTVYYLGGQSLGAGSSRTDVDEAWSEAVADSEHSSTVLGKLVGWRVNVSVFPYVALVTLGLRIEGMQYTGSFAGTLTAVDLGVVIAQSAEYTGGSFLVSAGSASSVDYEDLTGSNLYPCDPTDFLLSGTATIEFRTDSSPPGSIPFTYDDPAVVEYWTRALTAAPYGCYYYFDIAGELTDQAA